MQCSFGITKPICMQVATLCQIEIVWVFSGLIPVLMVLAGCWRGTVNPLSLGPLVWTGNPSGVSGSIPL
jgi:hypothetical protein